MVEISPNTIYRTNLVVVGYSDFQNSKVTASNRHTNLGQINLINRYIYILVRVISLQLWFIIVFFFLILGHFPKQTHKSRSVKSKQQIYISSSKSSFPYKANPVVVYSIYFFQSKVIDAIHTQIPVRQIKGISHLQISLYDSKFINIRTSILMRIISLAKGE